MTDLSNSHPPATAGPAAASASASAPPDRARRVSRLIRAVNLAAVSLPLAGLVAAMLLTWGWGFSWTMLALLLVPYFLTGVGITVGFHRLFTHRAFETTRPVKAVLGVLGSMAVEGPLLRWVASHRRHHQHSDDHGDPHSPHLHGEGLRAMLLGLWHAHVGWLFEADAPGLSRYAGDLRRDPMLRKIDALFPLWVLIGLLVPAALGGLLTLTWSGVLLGFLWGGLARIFLVHHTTWSINSVCHLWGSRRFETRDESRNNLVFGVLALGEGWHNNHHAFPNSARHGLRWWELDASYWIICGLRAVGLAWDVKVPTRESVAVKQAA